MNTSHQTLGQLLSPPLYTLPNKYSSPVGPERVHEAVEPPGGVEVEVAEGEPDRQQLRQRQQQNGLEGQPKVTIRTKVVFAKVTDFSDLPVFSEEGN